MQMRSNRKGKNTHQVFSLRKTIGIIRSLTRVIFWFSAGAVIGLFLFSSFVFIFFQKTHNNVIYPGVIVNGIDMGGKTKQEVKDYFAKKNESIADTKFVFTNNKDINTAITARELNFGYDETLLADQAYSIGRSQNVFSNITLVFQAYINGLYLPASYHYSESILENFLSPVKEKVKVDAVDALFTFENGRVSAFRPSSDGQDLDIASLNSILSSKLLIIVSSAKPQIVTVVIPIKVIKPKITTDNVNNFGIHEEIGSGTSLFQGSIPNRIHNVILAASKLNGVLVAPQEVFSFDNALGDVSMFTGYKQAYVIENGKTVLGDGGGVCQVSTTLFRAVLNAGLPVVERNAHAYRVHYYEEDSPPGIDATVYVPTVDFKFKNDTSKYILIQSSVDPETLRLTFSLYGTKDARIVTMTTPVITSQTPAPEPLYQDDPSLPKGTIKQIDFAAAGARVSFTRQVTKNGKVILSDTFVSNYRPWQAIFLRGTQ